MQRNTHGGRGTKKIFSLARPPHPARLPAGARADFASPDKGKKKKGNMGRQDENKKKGQRNLMAATEFQKKKRERKKGATNSNFRERRRSCLVQKKEDATVGTKIRRRGGGTEKETKKTRKKKGARRQDALSFFFKSHHPSDNLALRSSHAHALSRETKKEKSIRMERLPEELVALVFTSLPCAVLRGRATLVCRSWQRVADDRTAVGRAFWSAWKTGTSPRR